ncbi:hypothetical protein HQ45_06620 [Porphyromonas crevioricanis]|uniref:DUF4924 domain-containing protein n=1 Tax=Porphyromonas crevioricanis TaxID=393921 RepID=A0A0A2FUF0_9PORP|nr:DUF4924 family protein [Porphyromonas crevioricanis]KGN89664.1 hypothetical protein HQ45_06620 [Porphyromonas crevioricanis]KGN93782.1 hypothetical protein HQ38_08405 [Porphyromonas crevioricanis]GAD08066.1 hypothetical protein PORCAN_1700 [Porphyromonas crevioricanis JCM 13913]SQH72403.1 Uncharacterised protein [Porphyromonas crevioricanis]
MITADKLRADHIVNYLLYMWQVEDLIRACDLDMDKLECSLLSRYSIEGEEAKEIKRRYAELLDMMLGEGLRQEGHLNILRIVLMQLEDLHRNLLADPKEQLYTSLYYQVLPYIVGLREKSDGKECGEIETLLEGIYGYYLLKLQGKPVTKETTEALSRVGNFLTLLSERYKTKDEND